MSDKPRASVDLAGISRRLIANVEQVVVGKRQQIIKVLVAWYCEGHILLEDVPGVAKTILARAFARRAAGAKRLLLQYVLVAGAVARRPRHPLDKRQLRELGSR